MLEYVKIWNSINHDILHQVIWCHRNIIWSYDILHHGASFFVFMKKFPFDLHYLIIFREIKDIENLLRHYSIDFTLFSIFIDANFIVFEVRSYAIGCSWCGLNHNKWHPREKFAYSLYMNYSPLLQNMIFFYHFSRYSKFIIWWNFLCGIMP